MVAPGWTRARGPTSSMLATKKVLHLLAGERLGNRRQPRPYASALMTPAHSARPEAWLRRAQLARSATRSTVSTARADKGTGPWDEPRQRGDVAGGHRDAPEYSSRARSEKGDAALELELHRAGGPVTLLADDHLGLAADHAHLGCQSWNSSVPSAGLARSI